MLGPFCWRQENGPQMGGDNMSPSLDQGKNG